MKKIFRLSLLIVLIIFFSSGIYSCKKKEIPGPKGESGVNGTGGNSSTASSDVFVVPTTEWVAGTDGFSYVYNSTLITQKVVDSGAVKAYIEMDGAWWELPHADGDLFTQCGFSLGKVKLEFMDIHGGLPPRPATASFRLVTLFRSARPAKENSTNNQALNFTNSAK